MKISLNELRRIIREEVATMVFIHNAGFGGVGGVGNAQINKNDPIIGSDEEEDQEIKTYGQEQEKSQWTLRVRNREPRT